jgi:hypothetical protein
MSVRRCTEAYLELNRRHGKSPCFSQALVLIAVNVDWMGSFFAIVNMGDFLG